MSSDATGVDAATRQLRRPAVSRAVAAQIAEACAVVVALAVVVGIVAPTLGAPLLEAHPFRQTETAWTARAFHESGFDLLHPKMPVLGEPFEVPFEFPPFQALAALPMEAGLAEDTARRPTSLVCFVMTALLWGLVRYVAGPISGVAALVAFVFTPFAFLWSRTSMIEYLATAGAVGFALTVVLWRDRRSPVFVALAAGLVGMLVKPTTAVFSDPGLAARLEQARRFGWHRRRSSAGGARVLPPGAGGTWLRLGVAPPEARLFVGDHAPVPVRRAVFFASAASPDGSVVVTCTAAPALTLEGRGRLRPVVSHRAPYPELP